MDQVGFPEAPLSHLCSPARRPQQQRRQLTDCAFQWAELQEVSLGEEVDFHDNRGVFAEERNRRSDRKQVKTESLLDCECVEGTRSLSVCCSVAVNTHRTCKPIITIIIILPQQGL